MKSARWRGTDASPLPGEVPEARPAPGCCRTPLPLRNTLCATPSPRKRGNAGALERAWRIRLTHYDGALSLRDARARYFQTNDFGDDGGYSKRWVRIELGKIALYFPNLPSRVRAVRFHDLDHVLTGYETDLIGETEISAYEIASGCGAYGAAWVLNLQAFFTGLFLSPSRLFAAFRRGRQCGSLYHEDFNEALLSERVGAARTRLGIDHELPDSIALADRMSFAGWLLVSGLFSLVGFALLLAPLVALGLLLF